MRSLFKLVNVSQRGLHEVAWMPRIFFLHYCSNSRVKHRDVLDRGELERQRHQRKLFWRVFRKKRKLFGLNNKSSGHIRAYLIHSEIYHCHSHFMTEQRVRSKPVQHKKRNSSLFPIVKLLFIRHWGGLWQLKDRKANCTGGVQRKNIIHEIFSYNLRVKDKGCRIICKGKWLWVVL